MLRTIFMGLLITMSCSLQAQLVKSNEIFTSSQFQRFTISPSGKAFLGKSFIDGNSQLFAFKAELSSALEIFKLKNQNDRYIMDFGWVDDDTVYVTYVAGTSYTGRKRLFTRIIDIFFKEDDLEIDSFDMEVTGYVAHNMPTKEEKVLFARYYAYDETFELVELDITKLRETKHNDYNHNRIFDLAPELSDGLDKLSDFYINQDYQLTMVEQEFEGYTSYSIYDSEKESWQEYFRLTAKKDDSNDQSRLTVFEPIGIFDQNHIVALSNINRDKTAVVKFNLELKKATEVLYETPYYDIQNATYDSNNRKLTSVWYVEKGISRQKFLDRGDKQTHETLYEAIGLDSIFIADTSVSSNDLVVFAHDATHPGKFYHYNKSKNKLRFLQNSMPDLHPYSFINGRYLVVKNELEQNVEGFLYTPKSADNKVPLIVMPHGGPIGVQEKNEFDRETQFFVNRGYAVLTMNFRGSSGYGKDYLNSGRGQFGLGIERDINLMVDKVITQYDIDSSKMCIYGTSYGGYSAVTSSILNKSKYRCAIAAFGVFDLPLLYSASNIHNLKEVKDAISWVVGDIDANYDLLKDSSPLYRANEINIPVLLFAGKKDEVAHPEHSRRLNYALEKLGKIDTEFYEYNYSDHGHNNWDGDIHQQLTALEFLDKHLNINREHIDPRDKLVIGNDYYLLGMIYYNGYHLEKDTQKATHYLKLAHDYGDIRAAQYLRRLGVYDI